MNVLERFKIKSLNDVRRKAVWDGRKDFWWDVEELMLFKNKLNKFGKENIKN